MLKLRQTTPAQRTAQASRSVPIIFPASTFPGARAQEGAGRLINCYAEPLGPGMRHSHSRRRVAGLVEFSTSSQSGFRGMIESAGVLYQAFDGNVYKTTSAGGASALVGSLSGSAKCFFAKNNNSTPDVVVVDPGNGASVLTSSAVSAYPDADVNSPNAVCLAGVYFIFTYGDGKVRASGINTTAINSLDFVTAEGKPDAALCPAVLGDILYIFGSYSIELWSMANVNATGFPFNRMTVLPLGLAGRYTVTGWEDGSTMQRLFFVGSDGGCYLMGGASYEKISTPDIDRLVEAVADKDTLEAGVYVSQGRTVVVLSSDDWTREYSVTDNKWNERASHTLTRWRGTQPHYAFSKWLCGDTTGGNLYQISASAQDEDGDPLTMEVISAPVGGNNFIARVDLDVTVGVGETPGATDNDAMPVCEIAVSTDGGATFNNSQFVDLGETAKYRQRVFATRFGRSTGQGAVVKVAISDPVDVGIMGGEVTLAP